MLNEVVHDLVIDASSGSSIKANGDEDDDETDYVGKLLAPRDVLDALASLGLKLVPDPEGESSIAYLREIRRPASEAAPMN